MSAATQPVEFWYARPASSGLRREGELHLLLGVCWLLAVTCFTLPGRGGPLDLGGLDWIAALKILARGGSLLMLGIILVRMHDHRRMGLALARFVPLILFALWCQASFLWSPLQAVSFGHAIELVTLVMLSTAVAILVSTEDRLELVLEHLCLTAVVISSAILLLDFRTIIGGERPSNYMHPNTLGAVASTGLLILLGARLLWNWAWTRRWWIPGIAVCGGALYASRSRASLLATFVVLTILFLVRRKLLFLTVILALGGTLIALLPYVGAVQNVPDSIGSYILRGQTRADLEGASGRDELWGIALQSFLDAPWFGHGYYMMSKSGSFYVWHKQQYQTAHNLLLHVLTGTGIFGALLFLWGLGTAFRPCFRNLRGMLEQRRLEFLALLVLLWFLVLGCFEISILGPLDPAVVVFFGAMGLVAGGGK